METRQQIRRTYKKMRDTMSARLVQQLSAQAAERILQMECCRQAQAVYFYYPLGNELSLLPVVNDVLGRGVPCAFPKVSGDTMEFYQIFTLKELKEGAFHIMEPPADRGPVHWEHALCFVPGVVFDRRGGRLGYGKGYYDRCFSRRRSCILAGCAYGYQVVENLPQKPWDRRMDYLITEKEILSFE